MERHWLARPETIRKVWAVFIAVLAATVGAEFFVEHDADFGIDGTFAFYAWYGLIACVALIVIAKQLGFLLKRADNYYEERHD